jgi:ubiquinone/menaquinone biosynthesis C-methylase UbiE
LISNLEDTANNNGLKNIKPIATDITDNLPIEDSSIDICFVSTVLHTMDIPKIKDKFFNEIHRVLKPEGRLAIIECKKEKSDFGPPMNMRISSDEMETIVLPYGFKKTNLLDLGFNYMVQFVRD